MQAQTIDVTQYVANFNLTIRGRDYQPGAVIDDPEIPGYVIARLASRKRVSPQVRRVQVLPAGAAPETRQEARGAAQASSGPAPQEKAPKAARAARPGGEEPVLKPGDDLPAAYLNRWTAAWKRACRQGHHEGDLRSFVIATAAAAAKQIAIGDLDTRDALVKLREAEVTP